MKPSVILIIVLVSFAARAQWNSSGSDIINANSGDVIIGSTPGSSNLGIGTTSPNNAIDIVGGNPKLKIFSVAGPPSISTIEVESSAGSVRGAFETTYQGVGPPWYTPPYEGKVRIGSKNSYDFTLFSNDINRLTVKPDGKIGIGTATPSQLLDVNGIINATGIYINGAPFAGGGSQWTTSGSNVYFNSGNVGVGTGVPAEKLHINGSIRGHVNGAVRISTGSGWIDVGPKNTGYAHFHTDRPKFYFDRQIVVNEGIIASYDEDMNLQTGSTTRLTIKNTTGNVGIGTATPAYKLDVNGTINASEFYVNGVPFTGSSQWTTSGSHIYYNAGYLGIGTTAPTQKLHISGAGSAYIKLEKPSNSYEAGLQFSRNGSTLFYLFNDDTNNSLKIQAAGLPGEADHIPRMEFPVTNKDIYMAESGGNVGIGTTLPTNPNGYRLAVNGKIGAKEVQIETTSTTWPDYVFNDTYQLLPLSEAEQFIKDQNHLPEVPSAEEIEKNGHLLGETDIILLRKIEELTLYVIELKKENERQQKELDALKSSR